MNDIYDAICMVIYNILLSLYTYTAPNRPQSLRISPISSNSLWISWTQPSITGCRDIDNYSIQCNSSSIRTTTLTTYIVTNLALTSYNYRCCVRANNNARSGSETCNLIRMFPCIRIFKRLSVILSLFSHWQI